MKEIEKLILEKKYSEFKQEISNFDSLYTYVAIPLTTLSVFSKVKSLFKIARQPSVPNFIFVIFYPFCLFYVQ